MGDHRIDCTNKDGPDPDYRIDGFGGVTVPGNTRWHDTLDNLLAAMRNGHTFWVSVQNRRVEVIAKQHPRSKRWYATTEPDSFPPNNLLNLPDCR